MKQKQRALSAIARKKYWRKTDAEIVVSAWTASGHSQAEFARKHNVHVTRLRRWAKRLAQPSAPSFHPVEIVFDRSPVQASRSDLELVLRDGRRVSIGSEFDPDLLKRLVQTVESWSC